MTLLRAEASLCQSDPFARRRVTLTRARVGARDDHYDGVVGARGKIATLAHVKVTLLRAKGSL